MLCCAVCLAQNSVALRRHTQHLSRVLDQLAVLAVLICAGGVADTDHTQRFLR